MLPSYIRINETTQLKVICPRDSYICGGHIASARVVNRSQKSPISTCLLPLPFFRKHNAHHYRASPLDIQVYSRGRKAAVCKPTLSMTSEAIQNRSFSRRLLPLILLRVTTGHCYVIRALFFLFCYSLSRGVVQMTWIGADFFVYLSESEKIFLQDILSGALFIAFFTD